MPKIKLCLFRPKDVFCTLSASNKAKIYGISYSSESRKKMKVNGNNSSEKKDRIKKAVHTLKRSLMISPGISPSRPCLIGRTTYKTIKEIALKNVVYLEKAGKISRQNGF